MYQKIKERKIQLNIIQRNKKKILLVVMIINQFVLMIDLLKSFKSYIDENSAYYFINSIIKESKHCGAVKKQF